MKGTIKELGNSEIEIVGEIDAEKFDSYRTKAIRAINENLNIDGFRPGKIPEDILVQKVGEVSIMEEMAEMALRDLYPKFVLENNIEAIGRPEISITKVAKGNPLEFKIKTAVMPKIEIADYKNIAKDSWTESLKEKIEVSEKEIEDVITEVRKARAKKPEHTCTDEKCGDEHKKEEPVLPELTDDFVKSIGNFTDVKDFREKLKKNIELEKEGAKNERTRTQILDKIIEKTEIKVPKVLLENEINQVISEIRGKIEQLGLEFDKYLEQIKKTETDIRKEAEEPATKRVKYKLVLKTIAKEENIKVPEEEVMKEVDNLLKYYENADFNSAKMYIEDVLTNERVFQLLDDQKIK